MSAGKAPCIEPKHLEIGRAKQDDKAILQELLHSDEARAESDSLIFHACQKPCQDALYAVGFSTVEGMPWVQAQDPFYAYAFP